MDIREEWKCDEHDDHCYQKDGQHFPLNRWKLKSWAAAIVQYHFNLYILVLTTAHFIVY
jgi:hypothetical protein